MVRLMHLRGLLKFSINKYFSGTSKEEASDKINYHPVDLPQKLTWDSPVSHTVGEAQHVLALGSVVQLE